MTNEEMVRLKVELADMIIDEPVYIHVVPTIFAPKEMVDRLHYLLKNIRTEKQWIEGSYAEEELQKQWDGFKDDEL